MNKISILKEDKEYMDFLSELPAIQKLRDEHKALQKDIQKKRRRINTLIQKYTFLNDIVAVNNTGTKLSLSIKKALKSIGFSDVRHTDAGKREDVQLYYNYTMIAFEITGVSGVADLKKGRQTIANTLVAKKRNQTHKVQGCFIINHHNTKEFIKRGSRAFIDKQMNEEIDAAEVSLLTTITLRKMIIDIIKGDLTLEDFVQMICIVGEVKYNPA